MVNERQFVPSVKFMIQILAKSVARIVSIGGFCIVCFLYSVGYC
jgi:hypothetical protein